MFRHTTLLISLVAVCTGDVQTQAQEAAAEKTTYVDDVLPILKTRCGSCHNANDRDGGLVLDSFAGVMEGGSSGAVVEGGDLDASYLWQLVTHESEPFMPPESDKLPEDELAVIRLWIERGLLENSGSTAMLREESAVEMIEITTERPAEVALPTAYLGDPQHVAQRPNAVTGLTVSPWAPDCRGLGLSADQPLQHRNTRIPRCPALSRRTARNPQVQPQRFVAPGRRRPRRCLR